MLICRNCYTHAVQSIFEVPCPIINRYISNEVRIKQNQFSNNQIKEGVRQQNSLAT